MQLNSSSLTQVQRTEYYPFGMIRYKSTNKDDNKYLYNGKELQEDRVNGLKLNLYDYGARFYDAQLGRWHCKDPLEQFHSPYVFAANNPVNVIDPSGMWAYACKDLWEAWGTGDVGDGDEEEEGERDEEEIKRNKAILKLQHKKNVTRERLADIRDQRKKNIKNARSKLTDEEIAELMEMLDESGIQYNPAVVTALSAGASVCGVIVIGAESTVLESLRASQAIEGISSIAKISKLAGRAGLVLTFANGAYEYQTGAANTHTLADVGIATISAIGAAAAVSFSAPIVAGAIVIGGSVYGIVSFAGGGDWLDDVTDDWGADLIYGED